MPTLDDLDKKLQQLEDNLISEAPRIVLQYASDFTALAVQKLQKEGVPGAQYSTKPMLATQNMFNRKSAFKPDVIGVSLGRDENGKLIKGGSRTNKGTVRKKGTEKRYRWVRFPGASKAVPVMELEEGYKELRELNGLQTAHVDFTFTGRMVQNIGVVSNRQEGLKFLAVIGASDDENKKKMQGLFKRFGEYLFVQEEVGARLKQDAVIKFGNIVKSTLNP